MAMITACFNNGFEGRFVEAHGFSRGDQCAEGPALAAVTAYPQRLKALMLSRSSPTPKGVGFHQIPLTKQALERFCFDCHTNSRSFASLRMTLKVTMATSNPNSL
jgi:hypothetical protein